MSKCRLKQDADKCTCIHVYVPHLPLFYTDKNEASVNSLQTVGFTCRRKSNLSKKSFAGEVLCIFQDSKFIEKLCKWNSYLTSAVHPNVFPDYDIKKMFPPHLSLSSESSAFTCRLSYGPSTLPQQGLCKLKKESGLNYFIIRIWCASIDLD